MNDGNDSITRSQKNSRMVSLPLLISRLSGDVADRKDRNRRDSREEIARHSVPEEACDDLFNSNRPRCDAREPAHTIRCDAAYPGSATNPDPPRLIVVGSRSLIRARERDPLFLSRGYRQDRIVASQEFNVKYQFIARLQPFPSVRLYLYIPNFSFFFFVYLITDSLYYCTFIPY